MTTSDAREVTFLNTSWGPLWTEIGDIIVVAAGSELPLVLRKDGDFYLFIGACLLIDSQLTHPPTDLAADPGMSDIMHGNLCKSIGDSNELEEFLIH